MSKIEKVLESIKEILKKDTRGLTIQELSERTKVSRITAGMALMKLDGQGFMDERIIGHCKLHCLKESREPRKNG